MCSVKKVLLEISQNSQENTCARVSFLIKACNFIKKETVTQVFSCKFCKISKNNFSCKAPLAAASEYCSTKKGKSESIQNYYKNDAALNVGKKIACGKKMKAIIFCQIFLKDLMEYKIFLKDPLRSFIQFEQFKKREKHPWRSVASVKLQASRVTLFHGYI